MAIQAPALLMEEAARFISGCYTELGKKDSISLRLEEIESAIRETGTYEHTFEELVHGARMAWRNSNRCIGRLFWNRLHVLDARDASNEDEMYDVLLHHIRYATNGGKILPAITVFKQYRHEADTARIFNSQLIRYAGYRQGEHVIGDPDSLAFTSMCQGLGWRGEGTQYDILPLVFSMDGNEPICREIPGELVKEVQITHTDYPFDALGARWYATPFVSDMRLEIGGISYTAAPFNGWYIGTEIGARNLADANRYNLLPSIAEKMGLDTSRTDTLWKDKALVELTCAVLHSFKKAGVTIVDHHTAAKQFKLFEKQEAECGRLATGDWKWLIPPVSPALTHTFHQTYCNEIHKPGFFQQ